MSDKLPNLPPISIRRFQSEVAPWIDHNFGVPDPSNLDQRVTNVSATVEEAAEMLRAARKQAQGIRGTYEQWDEEIRKEAGDTFIALCQAAYTCGFDLYEAIVKRWVEVQQRDFKADPIGHGLPKDNFPVQCRRCTGVIMVIPAQQAAHDRDVHGVGSVRHYDYGTEGLGGT